MRPQFLHFSDLAAAIILTLLAVAVAIYDWRARRIPNRLVFPAACVGIALNAAHGWGGLGFSLGGLAVGFVLLFVPHLLGAMGAGDVKYLATVGSFVGASGVLRVFLLTLLFYPALALFCVFRDGKLKVTWLRFRRVLSQFGGLFVPALKDYAAVLESRDDARVASATAPFGVAISAGAMLAIFTSLLR